MPQLEKSALVTRDLPAVWAFLARRENSPLIVPNLLRVWDVAPADASLGQTWKFEFRLLGLPVQGAARMTAFEPGRSFQFETGSAIESRWTYDLAPAASGTRVTVAVSYTLPPTWRGRIEDSPTLHELLAEQASGILRNLEARLRA